MKKAGNRILCSKGAAIHPGVPSFCPAGCAEKARQAKKTTSGSEGIMRAHRRFSVLLAVLLILFPLVSVRATQRLTILHVNDFHGRLFPYVDKAIDPSRLLGGAAYLAKQIEKERARNPEGAMLLSAGDMFQGTPVSNLFRGRPVLDLMNRLHFDVMALGNHEFDWGPEVLRGIVTAAQFPVLCANIVDDKGLFMEGVKPYVMIQRKGFKVAVIGVVTPELLYMVNAKYLAHLTILEPVRVVPGLVRKVKREGAQVVVLLTHLGLEQDKRLAAAMEGIDVIVGGHSHTVVMDPIVVGKTIIVQAGYNGLYLGVLELALDERTGRIVDATRKSELRLVSAGEGDSFDKGVAQIAESYNERIRDRFRQVVGETRVDLMRRADGESALGDVITDAMRASTGADVALHNSGGIRADILAGPITMEEVYTVLPFDDVVVTMDLKGSDLLEIFEKSTSGNKGMLQVSGARIEYDPASSADKKVTAVRIGGAPLGKDRTYRVSTNDFLAAGGDRFGTFGRGTNVVYGVDLREVFVEYVKAHSPLSLKGGERIIMRKPVLPGVP
jgi:2',3'-cyclic-nucleotide 2'-phosphodiesterase (5'-nucleotidase family)